MCHEYSCGRWLPFATKSFGHSDSVLSLSHSVTHALILLDLVRLRILAESRAHNSLAAAKVAARGSSALLNLGCARCVCDLVCRDTGGTPVAAT